ncbi:hypothetical protein CE91St36_21520 [Christensenellaceae bacterium]|nr:hypothetical protein CE91St36_21520 [Christensenellaceae bacterium]BDF62001.1 hypothetical protein CE91St37_21510 [Christensenellaceae bacterium]
MKIKTFPPINMRNISSIQLKFVMVFIGILLIACVASMVVVSAFMQSALLKDIEERIVATSRSISRLAEETELPLDEIIEMVGSSYYDIHVYDPQITTLPGGITQDQLLSIQPDEISFITDETQSQKLPLGILKVRDSYLVMTSHTENNEILYFRNIAFMVLVICAGIGSILMLLAVTHITKPVKRLTRATQEVAKGNFDISVEYDAQDEIGQLTHNFNLMTNELKNMEYLRKDFVSNVSHEFKTPIASIRGFAQLLKTKDLTKEEFDEYTDVIIDESTRLSKLSENLLRLSRLEKQVIPTQNAEFSLDEQIRKTLLLLEREWSAKELELDIDLDTVTYSGNEEMMQQIWINLLSNAIKFSHLHGTLCVRLKKEKGQVRSQISDTGVGIAADAIPRIFEKFYQGDASHSKEGNGLGLAIVRQIVESCGGTISVESTEGKGTTFTVLLPIPTKAPNK